MPWKTKEDRAANMRRWRAEHHEARVEYERRYREENRERLAATKRASHKRTTRQTKGQLVERLGGRCQDCGNADERVFQFHHVNGDGREDRSRRRGYDASTYKRMLERLEREPGSIALLCANCHLIRHWGME